VKILEPWNSSDISLDEKKNKLYTFGQNTFVVLVYELWSMVMMLTLVFVG
jgi:hypothetical protein